MKYLPISHSFKLTTLSFSLSMISTMAISSSVNLIPNKNIITGQNINASYNEFAIYSKNSDALPGVDLLIEDSDINSGKTAVFIDKRSITKSTIGDINVAVNNSKIKTNTADGDGIYVAPVGKGNVDITTDDQSIINIEGKGNNSFGIAVQVDRANIGNIRVDNAATINTTNTTGNNNSGLFLQSQGVLSGDIFYRNNGKLNILRNSNGIHLSIRNKVTGDISVINDGKISSNLGLTTPTGAGIYLEQRANVDKVANIVNSGSISGFGSGILVSANSGVSTSANILLANNGQINDSIYGINSNSLENTNITIEDNAKINAKNTAIFLDNKNNNQTTDSATNISNNGIIGSESGKLVHSVVNNKNKIMMNNNGSMTGYIELLGSKLSHTDNAGIWDMSNYTSDFGQNTQADNSLMNSGKLITANNNLSSSQTSTFKNVGTFKNSGLITMENGSVGDITRIEGDYAGQNGTLLLDTHLGDDNSLSDKLVVTGKATGTTEIEVKNVSGLGAQTTNGILIVETGSSESENTFYLRNNYVSAGSYDYGLFLENENNLDNWYLKSHLRNNIPVYTPDTGSYLAVATMGNTLFSSRLEDREGASQYQDSKNTRKDSVWIRAYGGQSQFKSMGDQLQTKGNSAITQIGSGLATLGEEDQYNLGVMGGFAYYDGKTRSNLTNRESKAKIEGYSLGLYGTWYAHPVETRGAYIDTWVLWNKFNNTIDSADQNSYDYDSSGITASIEVGGDYLLNKNGKKDWWIQPQAQLTYQGVHADDFKDAQGLTIHSGEDNLQARLGFKTYLNIPSKDNEFVSYRPYLALNYIHNTAPYSIVIDDVNYENKGSKNLGEIKLGVEGHTTENSQIWLNVSYVAGRHNNQTYQANIGWKYNF